ncbi:TetR/AcrR family transcriptional regulator [Frankia sp. AgB1.9]|uniref:TetR/AcrR family transcriptional regulator n=1 Tax=unclassified Frankia TaxID=2632575 RepID=UPI001931285F|nr:MULTISPECIES: TetR/AcrR family transcriptional regulator [unclassified Frankia]MBL7494017.1 TetR/AcrR family transcriptional regulator [Frankia sp. AgW1.1]MBL7549249.1 TetR/AcrR family transcriptional regulator [Frankia sp. AgB1.9]MBL7619466.1 TetR/AcrR family transcriptional regulator [Frankia sp. AgB1.8]
MAAESPALSNQRRRTRAALLQAAGRLLTQGVTPTVAQVADEALVSRRTAYRYFPTADQLLADAALELTAGEITSRITATDPLDRVDELVSTVNEMTLRNEQSLRTLVRTTLDAPRDADGPRRGLRRMAWIEQVLEPVRAQLSPTAFRRVTAALALTVGIEARLSLVDVAGLTDGEADLVSRWVARIIVAAALADPGDATLARES